MLTHLTVFTLSFSFWSIVDPLGRPAFRLGWGGEDSTTHSTSSVVDSSEHSRSLVLVVFDTDGPVRVDADDGEPAILILGGLENGFKPFEARVTLFLSVSCSMNIL